MTIVRIPAETRGLTKLVWLTSHHSFSFGEYYNPKKMGFGKLRVLNEDTVAPGKGFGMHFHDNMEIVTFVLQGSLEHKDSTGGEGILKAGQMQRMTAGKGIQHSEFNPSKAEPVHFLQIWITPKVEGVEPEYEQKEFAKLLKPGQLTLLVSPQREEDGLFIHQDIRFSMARMDKGMEMTYTLSSERNGVYAFLIEGKLKMGEELFSAGDAAEVTREKQFSFTAIQHSLFLLIETLINS
jgi:redox-sensitive bicupin YhaK (pirin superfamily)